MLFYLVAPPGVTACGLPLARTQTPRAYRHKHTPRTHTTHTFLVFFFDFGFLLNFLNVRASRICYAGITLRYASFYLCYPGKFSAVHPGGGTRTYSSFPSKQACSAPSVVPFLASRGLSFWGGFIFVSPSYGWLRLASAARVCARHDSG